MAVRRLWPVLAVLLPAVASLLAPMSTVDLTYQIRAGDLMLSSGAVLRADAFTFSVFGQPWLDQQWAAQILLSVVHDAGGWLGLALLRALLVALVCGLVQAAARASGVGFRAAAGIALATFALGAPAMALRPQLFGMVCFAAVLALLASRHERTWLVFLVVPVTIAWANLHGSFVLAPVAVAVAFLTDLASRARIRREMIVVLVATALATFVTPWGSGAWSYAIELARDPRLRDLVTEWQPPAFPSYELFALAGSLLVALGVVLVRARLRDWPTVVWLLVLAVLAGTSARGIAWWAVGAPLALGALVAGGRLGIEARIRVESELVDTGRPERPAARWLGALIVLVLVASGGALLVPWAGADPVLGPEGRLTDAPRGVATALQQAATSGDRVFAAQRWGSWLEWTVPQALVFVDSRIELFPTDVWADQLTVSRGDPGWDAILSRWDVQYLAVSRAEQPGLAAAALTSPRWQVVHEDGAGIVLIASGR